jgi:hypothetical protein
MWMTKLFDILTLGLTWYLRKEDAKREHKFDMEEIELKERLQAIRNQQKEVEKEFAEAKKNLINKK